MSVRDEAAGGVELLPCPFCGGTDLYWPHGTDPAVIECGGKNGCGARSGVQDEQTEAHAAAAWNRRSPSPRDQACSAMLAALIEVVAADTSHANVLLAYSADRSARDWKESYRKSMDRRIRAFKACRDIAAQASAIGIEPAT